MTENKVTTILLLLFIAVISLASAEVLGATIGLKTTNTVNIIGEINSQSVAKVKKDLLALDFKRGKKKYPIYLVIDSGGGSIHAGNSLIDVIHSVRDVRTITYFAASMAAGIVQQTKGSRYIVGNGIMMFHRASGGFRGQFNDGELEQQLKLWKAIVTEMEQKNADRLGITLALYKTKVKDEYWLNSTESIKDNAVDRVITVKCSKKLIDQTFVIKKMSLLGQYVEEVSACPAAR